jgi:hypothetical protein
MLQKDCKLSIQIDATATPKHDNGAIFVQTVSDYPLVEAIYQNVVKHPILPDAASCARLREHQSAIFTERYVDYLQLGVEEWRKSHAEHEALAKKSVFSKIVGEPNAGGFELKFARFLDEAPDIVSFAKNYLAVGFKIDYVRANGDLSNYVPDFIVKTPDGTVWIIETKGREEIDLPQKMARLRQWCIDASEASQAEAGPRYRFVYVDQAGYQRNPPTSLVALVAGFGEYQQVGE